jgi:hypothetical protein
VNGQLTLFGVADTPGRTPGRRTVIARYQDRIPEWVWLEGNEQWYAYGLYFGYPLCCIEAFCLDEPRPDDWREAARLLGYVPCAACLADLTTETDT